MDQAGCLLIVTNVGKLLVTNSTYDIVGGYGASANNNTAVVTGAGSVWSNPCVLYIGYSSSVGAGNQLTIANRGTVYNTDATIGSYSSSSNNIVLVTGEGSLWANSGTLTLGSAGGNQLTISNGGTVYDAGGGIGGGSNIVLVTGNGSVWTNSTDLLVGNAAPGNSQLTISDGGKVYNKGFQGTIGGGANSNTVLVTGSDSVWNNNADRYLMVGNIGSGNQLIITNGGKVYMTGSYGAYIGYAAGDNNNAVLVTGPGSLWANSATLIVGNGGVRNQLTILSGGQVSAAGVTVGGTNNTITLTTGGLLDASSLTITADTVGNVISNNGGIYQFSASTPPITPASGCPIVVNSGTIAFRNVTNVNVKANWINGTSLGNMTFTTDGTNAFRLNASINAETPDQTYTFAPGLGATNYARLEMMNGSTGYRGGNVNIGSGGSLLFSNTTAWLTGSLTNTGGTITVVDSTVTIHTNFSMSAGTLNWTLNSVSSLITVHGKLTVGGNATFNLTRPIGTNDQLTVFSSDNPILGSLSGWTCNGLPPHYTLAIFGQTIVMLPLSASTAITLH
jgi:T5SS/PEP-CTERM-associated repeat protein